MSESPPSGAADPIQGEQDWGEMAKSLVKVELKRRNVTYEDLAKRLQLMGVKETEVSIRNKISRGTFPATFLLQCMHALGVRLIPFKPTTQTEVILMPELLAAAQGLSLQKNAGN